MALQTLRTHSKGWVAGILFFFLIVAFAAWGIEDMLRQGFTQTGPVMTVGKEQVSAREFESQYQRMIRNLQDRLERQFDYETAKSLGFVDALVAEIQSERIFAQEARARGLLIDDSIAREQIRSDPTFRGADGRFDPATFRQALQNAGLSEAGYVAAIKGNFARNFLVTGIAQFETVPKTLADKLFAHRNEFRVAEVLTIPLAAIKVPAPTDAQLAAYHKENAAKYTAPAMRAITLVLFRPDDAAQRVNVTEADIAAEYARRKPEFTVPESRAMRQLIFKDEATAKAAYGALVGGRSFETVAKDIAKAEPINLGKVTKDQLPIPALRDAAFKLEANQVTAPVQSPLGWHILRVDEIAKETVKPLDDVKAEIEKDFRARNAIKVLAELRDKFDDALGSGGKLEAAAAKANLKAVKLGPFDAQGKDDKGATVEGLPDDPEFLRRVFRQAKGEEGDLVDLKNHGFYSVRVDDVTNAAIRPLEAVKEKVAADWTAEERGKLAKAEAERLMAEVKAGKSLEEAAKPGGYEVKKSKPVNRGEGAAATPGSLEERVFSVKPGEVTLAQPGGGWAVVKVAEAKDERSEAEIKKAREEFEKSLKQAYEQDFLAEYTDYLRTRYPLTVDRAAIDRLLGGTRRP